MQVFIGPTGATQYHHQPPDVEWSPFSRLLRHAEDTWGVFLTGPPTDTTTDTTITATVTTTPFTTYTNITTPTTSTSNTTFTSTTYY